MKYCKAYLIISFLFFSTLTIAASSSNDVVQKSVIIKDKEQSLKNEALFIRLLEIKNMDKSNLSKSQKKALRKEVKAIGKEKVHGGGGIYLSISAIVIILLLLIILL